MLSLSEGDGDKMVGLEGFEGWGVLMFQTRDVTDRGCVERRRRAARVYEHRGGEAMSLPLVG